MNRKNILLLLLMVVIMSFNCLASGFDTTNITFNIYPSNTSINIEYYGGVSGLGNNTDYGLYFNGTSSYLDIGTWSDSDIHGNMVIDYKKIGSGSQTIVNNYGGGGSSQHYQLYISEANNNLILFLDDGVTGDVLTTPVNSFNENITYNISFGYNSSNNKRYIIINGTEYSDTFSGNDPDFSQRDSLIGIRQTNLDDYFKGNITRFSLIGTTQNVTFVGDQLTDLSSNVNNINAYNGIITSNNNSFVFDGADDYLKSQTSLFGNTVDTFSFWFNPDSLASSSGTEYLFDTITASNRYALAKNGVNSGFVICAGATRSIDISSWWVQNDWTNVVIQCKSGDIKLYFNGVLNDTFTNTFTPASQQIYLGRDNTGTSFTFDGEMSNFAIFNDELTQSEITEIYNLGRNQNYFNQTIITFDYPYEKIQYFELDTPVTVQTQDYTTIYSSNLVLTENSTGYFTSTSTIRWDDASNPPDSDCTLFVNDVMINAIKNNSYTLVDSYSNAHLMSEIQNLSSGTNTIDLRCKGTTTKEYTITSSSVSFKQFVNTEDYNFSYGYIPVSYNVNNPTLSFFNQTNYTTNYYNTTDTNYTLNLNIDIDLQFDFNADENLEGYLNVSGFICPLFKLYGETGNTKSGSYHCLIENVTMNSTYSLNSYYKGNFDLIGKVYVKEQLVQPNESTYQKIENVSFDSTTWQKVATNRVYKSSSAQDIYSAVSLSGLSTLNDFTGSLRMDAIYDNGTQVTGNEYNQTVLNTNQATILSVQQLFKDLPIGYYNISLYAKLSEFNSVLFNSTIVGANFISYSAGKSDTTPNTFTITAIDNILNTSIQSFSISDGILISTNNGVIEYPKSTGLVNLTLISDNYFNTTVLNHNTTQDLEFSVTPYPYFNITVINSITNQSVQNFTIYSDYGNGSTTNGVLLLQMNQPLANGTVVELTFDSDGYAISSFNKTINGSLNQVELEVFTTNSIYFNFYNANTHALIDNETVEVLLLSNVIEDLTYSYNTTNGTLFVDLISPNDYTVYVTSPSYQAISYTLTVVNKTTQTSNSYLYPAGTTTEFKYTVLSRTGDKLEGATIKALQFFNDSWNIVQECDTNQLGNCFLNLVENDFYHYYVFYNDDLVPKFVSSQPEQANYENNERSPFIIDLVDDTIGFYEDYFKVNIIDFSKELLDNNTNLWRVRLQANWNENAVDDVCMRWYRANPYPQIELCDVCLGSQGAITYCNATLGTDDLYYAEVYSKLDERESPVLDRLKFDFTSAQILLIGIVLTLFICIFGASIGWAVGDPMTALLGLCAGLGISRLLSLNTLSWGYIIVITIICIILVQGKKDGGK